MSPEPDNSKVLFDQVVECLSDEQFRTKHPTLAKRLDEKLVSTGWSDSIPMTPGVRYTISGVPGEFTVPPAETLKPGDTFSMDVRYVAEPASAPIEPEEIIAARNVLARVSELIDKGEVESISVYIQRRDDTYQTLQSRSINAHEEAGVLMELLLSRLGFVDRRDVERMIEDAR